MKKKVTKRVTINVGGRELPCYPTMGAMVRYEKMVGEDVTAIGSSLTKLGTYLYCSTASACSREGVPFDMEMLQFADAIDIADLNAWAASIAENPDDEKKAKGVSR